MLTVTDKINTGTASGSDGGEEINNQDKTITENGEYTADDGYTGLGTVTVSVSDIPAVIEELNVTPSTSAQVITAPEGTDGYSPVNVSAVTSSIDANIQAGNIKSGVSILSVTGSLEAASTLTATNTTGSAVTSGDKVWIEPNGANYEIVNFSTYSNNFTTTGSPLISNGILSYPLNDYSYNNYISMPTAPSNPSAWEFVVKLRITDKTTYDINNKSNIIGTYYSFSLAPNISVGGSWSGNKGIGCDLGYGSFLCFNYDDINDNQWLWVKESYSSGSVTVSKSTDGTTWTTVRTDTLSPSFNDALRCGGKSGIWSGPVEVDLTGTYLDVNGSRFWTPVEESVNVTSNAFSGVASQNIANNASGTVTVGTIKPKYNATIDNFLGNVDANGKMLAPQTTDLVFTGVTSFSVSSPDFYGGHYMFYGNVSINNVSFPDIVNITDMSILYSAFARSNIKSLTFDKLETVSGISALNDACPYSHIESVSFPELVTISNGFQNFCSNTYGQTLNISFPKLKTITGSGVNIFDGAFRSSKIVSAEFPELETVSVTQSNSCSNVFNSCSNLTSLSLPKLKSASYMQYFCGYCNNLTSISLPNLEEITQVNGFDGFCRRTGITTFTFTKLKSIKSSLNQTFRDCTSLTDLYFPALDTFGGYNTIGTNMLQGCSNVTVHFPSNLQSVIGSWSDVTAGFGGTNTTILFDLPATE